MNDIFENGMVWFVGAGPGDPDLLTRKAEKLINRASVIFYDALVGQGVLDLAAPPIKLIPVGKRSGRHSKDQSSINDMLVSAALAGEKVVRLKGGDPSIFGRLTEEMDALSQCGIAYKICPGITAASAAAASANVSLTLRGLARKLVYITAHAKADETINLDWQSLADPKSTIAIYMGKSAAKTISEELMKAGLCGSTPLLLVENASLPNERKLHTRLDLLTLSAQSALGDGPALMVIGEAVRKMEREKIDEKKLEAHFLKAR